jgi:hypothetical protein
MNSRAAMSTTPTSKELVIRFCRIACTCFVTTNCATKKRGGKRKTEKCDSEVILSNEGATLAKTVSPIISTTCSYGKRRTRARLGCF